MGPIRCYHSGPEWTRERCQWRGTPHPPKLQQYWNLTIRLFNAIFRTLFGRGSYPSPEVQWVYSTAPTDWAIKMWEVSLLHPLCVCVCVCVCARACVCASLWVGGGRKMKPPTFSYVKYNRYKENNKKRYVSPTKNIVSTIVLSVVSHGQDTTCRRENYSI